MSAYRGDKSYAYVTRATRFDLDLQRELVRHPPEQQRQLVHWHTGNLVVVVLDDVEGVGFGDRCNALAEHVRGEVLPQQGNKVIAVCDPQKLQVVRLLLTLKPEDNFQILPSSWLRS